MSAGNVKATVTLDSSQFEQSADRVTKKTEAMARAQENASQRAQAAWQKELVAQDRATQKSAEAARAKELSALQADILARSLDREEKSQAQVALGLDRWVKSVDGGSAAAARAAVANQAFAASHDHLASSASHSVSQMQATSAAIRTLEGNPGIRAFERFVTTIPGAGAALQAIFPLIGMAAAAAAIYKIGEEVYEVEQKAHNAGEVLRHAFSDLTDEARIANETLTVTSDKLEDEIAKLSKKPGNGLQTGLDQATLASDQLGRSLDKNIDKMKELFEKNKVGFLGSALSGAAETKDTANLVIYWKNKTDETRRMYDAVVQQARDGGNKDDVAQAEQRALIGKQNAYALQDAALKNARDAAQRAQDFRTSTQSAFGSKVTVKGSNVGYDSSNDNAANLSILNGALGISLEEQQQIGGEARKSADQTRKDELSTRVKGPKDSENKAARDQMKDFEGQLAARKMGHEVSIAEEYRFWETMAAAAAKYPENLLRVNEKIGQFRQEMLRKTKEEQKAAAAMASRDAEEGMRALEAGAKGMEAWKRSQRQVEREKTATVYTEDVQNAQNEAALRAIGLQHESGRSMTQLAAARELAAVHTREFNRAEADLLVNLKAIQDNTDLKPEERERATDAAQKNLNQFRNQRTVQVLQDQYSINTPDSSALVGAKDALESFTRSATDSAKMMQDLVGHALEGVNRNLVEELTSRSRQGPRHLWTGLGKNLATEATGSALKQGEGLLLKSIGFGGGGKPDGTQARPMWVRMADALGSTLGKGASEAASGLGSLIGKVAPIFGLPGFADGVTNFGGGMAIVGERGPEILSLPRGSSVTPNHAINNGFSSGMTFAPTIHVNGNADPAQTRAMVNQGLAEALPHFKAAAATHIADQKRRQVGSK